MNFGNKKDVAPTRVIQNNNAEQIAYDKTKYTEFNNAKKKKVRRGLFNKNKEDVESSTTSETLWREVNLFWPETIALVAAVVAGAILMFVVRFISATGLELIKGMLTDQAYNEVAGLLMMVNTLFLGVAAIPFLVLIGFYAYRLFVFTPRGSKYMVARVERTGAIRLSVDKIKNNALKFSRGIMGEEMKVVNPKKHWLSNLGKPFIFLFEGDDSNADLNLMAGNVSDKATYTNTVNDSMFDLGVRWERKMREKAGQFLTPTNILLIIILGVVALVAFLVLKNPETTAGLLGAGGLMIQKGGLQNDSQWL